MAACDRVLRMKIISLYRYVVAVALCCSVMVAQARAEETPAQTQMQTQTIEEKVLMATLVSMAGAKTYDEVCNDSKIAKAKPDEEAGALWLGNRQVLAFLIAAPMKIHNPQDTVEQGVKRLLDAEDKISGNAKAVLKKDGCKSERAQKMEKALKTFTTMPPPVLQKIITEKVERDGGKMTVLPDELNQVTDKKAAPEKTSP